MKKLMEKISWQNEYQKLLLESMKVELVGLPEGYLIPKKIRGKNYTIFVNQEMNSESSNPGQIRLLTTIIFIKRRPFSAVGF